MRSPTSLMTSPALSPHHIIGFTPGAVPPHHTSAWRTRVGSFFFGAQLTSQKAAAGAGLLCRGQGGAAARPCAGASPGPCRRAAAPRSAGRGRQPMGAQPPRPRLPCPTRASPERPQVQRPGRAGERRHEERSAAPAHGGGAPARHRLLRPLPPGHALPALAYPEAGLVCLGPSLFLARRKTGKGGTLVTNWLWRSVSELLQAAAYFARCIRTHTNSGAGSDPITAFHR